MKETVLQRFLNNGLVNVGGDDAKLEKLSQAAKDLADILKDTPSKALNYSLIAFDREALGTIPASRRRSLPSRADGPPTEILLSCYTGADPTAPGPYQEPDYVNYPYAQGVADGTKLNVTAPTSFLWAYTTQAPAGSQSIPNSRDAFYIAPSSAGVNAIPVYGTSTGTPDTNLHDMGEMKLFAPTLH